MLNDTYFTFYGGNLINIQATLQTSWQLR